MPMSSATCWVFPQNTNRFYRIDLRLSDNLKQALGKCQKDAWSSVVSLLEDFVGSHEETEA